MLLYEGISYGRVWPSRWILLSLADLPIVGHDRLTRRGVIEAKNEDDGLKYKIRDVDDNRVEWIPENDVEIGEIHNGDTWTDWRKRKENYE